MEKKLEGLAALIVSSWALKWAEFGGSIYFHDKSKQPSWEKACKLKNRAELVSLPLLVGSAPRPLSGWGFQVEVEGNAWVGGHPQKWGSSARTTSVWEIGTQCCVKGASGTRGC